MTIRTCKHPKNQCIIDQHEGTLVCSECALVLNESILLPLYTPEYEMNIENVISSNKDNDRKVFFQYEIYVKIIIYLHLLHKMPILYI